MKLKHKFALGMAALSVTLMGMAKSLEDVDMDKAQARAKSLLEQVMPKQPQIPENSKSVSLPDVQSRVPVIPNDNGQVQPTKALVDPFEVAERAKKQYTPEIDRTMMEGTNMVVFVSYSMPEASLKRIASEVAKVGGTMVLRGFVNDNLKDTVAASQIYNNLGAQIQIHPELFKEFNVTQVPTFVLTKPGAPLEGCGVLGTACNNYLKVEGDASMRAVLERFGKTPQNPLAASADAVLAILESNEP